MRVAVLTIHKFGICHLASQLVDALAVKCDAVLLAPVGGGSHIRPPAKYAALTLPPRRVDPRFLGGLIHAASIIRKSGVDIVHMQETHPLVSLAIPLMGRRARRVVTIHDVDPHPGDESWHVKIGQASAVRQADALILHGQYLRDAFLKQYPDAEHKVHVSLHPVRTIFDKWADVSVTEEPNILFFGRIRRYKGLEVLLRAVPRIHEALPDYTVTIAGDGDLRPYQDLLESCPSCLEIENRQVPDSAVARLYQRCRIVAMPYLEASQSGILATAYAFRKPVVVTSVGSLPEVVDDGRTGLVIPSGDHTALANALIRLAQDPALRAAMRDAITSKVGKELSWEVAAENHLRIYQSLL